jgi:hypothetical protein
MSIVRPGAANAPAAYGSCFNDVPPSSVIT